MNRAIIDYFGCPERFADFRLAGPPMNETGFFLFGSETICFGEPSSGLSAPTLTASLYDTYKDVTIEGASCSLPFDPTRVIDNLRFERYVAGVHNNVSTGPRMRGLYYFLRPAMPVSIRKHLQKIHFRGWSEIPFPKWPVDRTVEQILDRVMMLSLKAHRMDRIPFIWFWPNGSSSCAIMTHDVETALGRDFCPSLMEINDRFGIKSSFQIVPEKRYPVPRGFLNEIRNRGFEVNIHDLNHDGHLFRDREHFVRRAERINQYAKEFGAQGFRSGLLDRNVDWCDALDFSYDMSVPNVAHLEPQRGGCCTVMPYFIGQMLELPVTTTQDYSLFNVLEEYSIELWKRQIDLIMERHGLISFIIHPDYIIDDRPRNVYINLLGYLSQLRSRDNIWIALPGELNRWWRERSQMKIVGEDGKWRIEGNGKERARLAYASLKGESLVYTVEGCESTRIRD